MAREIYPLRTTEPIAVIVSPFLRFGRMEAAGDPAFSLHGDRTNVGKLSLAPPI
jgi:hypothetical protein